MVGIPIKMYILSSYRRKFWVGMASKFVAGRVTPAVFWPMCSSLKSARYPLHQCQLLQTNWSLVASSVQYGTAVRLCESADSDVLELFGHILSGTLFSEGNSVFLAALIHVVLFGDCLQS